jgi:hypothetical protein
LSGRLLTEYRQIRKIEPAYARPVDARVTTKCSHCSFEVSAPLEEARAAFERHACDRPRPETSSRRRRGFSLR